MGTVNKCLIYVNIEREFKATAVTVTGRVLGTHGRDMLSNTSAIRLKIPAYCSHFYDEDFMVFINHHYDLKLIKS